MRPGSPRRLRPRSRIAPIVWGLASLLVVFTAENIWIDAWLRNKYGWIPSLVPDALSGAWFLDFAVCGIALTLLVVCQILLIRESSLRVSTKVATGMAMLVAAVLCVQWIRVTTGHPALHRQEASNKTHTVTLTWQASTSQVAGYRVYRSTTPGANYVNITAALVMKLTYADTEVISGVTYYYVARAVDDRNQESANSNETSALIP